MKFYRIFRTTENEDGVETDAKLTVNGGVVADLTGDLTGSIAGVAVTSGDGAPDGAAAVGAIYIDTTNANIYINVDVEGSWKLITRAAD